MIKITIEGDQGSGKTSLAFSMMLWLAKQKRFFPNKGKWKVTLHDEPKPWQRKPYETLPDILIIIQQTKQKQR